MSVQVRPQARFAAALLAASVVSAASVAGTPEHRALPILSIDVANASAVTDGLYGLGDGVGFLSSMVGIHVDAAISLPFEATLAVLAAAQHPDLAPNVLSYLVQRFVNPAVGDPIHAYPYDTEQAFAVLATLFPYPLGPSATEPGLINEARLAFADVFNSVLGQLPDPMPGYQAVQGVMNDTVLGGTLVAVQNALRAPLYMAWNTVNYLGYLAANVEATLESAIQTPDQLPGLTSNLAYGLLSPDPKVGLFGQLLDNATDPFTWLPKPIGQSTDPNAGLANETRDAIAGAVNGILSVLPKPVKPSAAQTPPDALPTGTSVGFGESAATMLTKPLVKRSEPTTLATSTPATPGAEAADQPAAKDASTSATDAATAVRPNKADRKVDKRGEAKVRSGQAKHRKDQSIKDRVTHALTRGDHTKAGKAKAHQASGKAA